MSDLLEGVQLSDFLLIQCIGKGGVADVYRGRHVGLVGGAHYDVAVKVFQSGYAQREAFRDYFMAEAEKIGQFEHPNILPFLEFGEGESLLYAVTPYIESGTLGDLLNRVGGKFSAMQALPIMQQLCSALQYAHERDVIHGNIKLSNVFVGTDGRMLLADFGIVRGYDDSQQSLTSIGWGSAEFAAPEQSLGVLRRASDIYALGALLFRILTGQPPYTGQTPVEVLLKHVRLQTPSARSVDPHISDTVDTVLQKAMQKRSDDRFTTPSEFFDALQTAVTVSPVASPVARAVSRTSAAITRQLSPATGSLFDSRVSDTQAPMPTDPLAAPPPTAAPDAFLLDQVDHRSTLFESPPRQMSPVSDPIYQEGIGRNHEAGVTGQKHFLQDNNDAGTHLFWSVDPLEWSPIANEQVGSVPLTAEDYLQSMPLAQAVSPIKPVESGLTALPDTNLAQPGKFAPARESEQLVKEPRRPQGKRKNLLPVLVVALLLVGLVGALLSSFFYPGPSGNTITARPGTTATQAGGAASTPAGATATSSSSSPTVVATGAATPQPSPSPATTPVPIPTNPPVPQFACSSGTLAMDGSASFIPDIEQLTTDYNSQCSNSVNFAFNTNDSQTGLNNLMNGSVDLAYTDLPSSGRPGLVNYQVAALIFAVAVNSDTQVTNLTTAQLQGIYTGSITNWSQVGGTNEPIVILTQPQGSTLRTIFETYVLHGTAQTVPGLSSAASVKNLSGGIAYMPLADVPAAGSGAQVVSINGVAPITSTVKNGSYPFWSIEHFYTNHAAQGAALSFISFCLSASSANDIVNSGSIPYADMPDAALRSHLPAPTI